MANAAVYAILFRAAAETLRLIAADPRRLGAMTDDSVSFRWKDYRQEGRHKVMTLEPAEFMRRFLLHVLPSGFHRIRHFGFLANGHRAARLALCRQLLAQPVAGRQGERDDDGCTNDRCAPPRRHRHEPEACPDCGSLSLILSTLPRAPPTSGVGSPPMIAASIVSGMLTAPVFAVCARKGARAVRPARSSAVDHRPPGDVRRQSQVGLRPDVARAAHHGNAKVHYIAASDCRGSQRSDTLHP